jgi:hypothetical protein
MHSLFAAFGVWSSSTRQCSTVRALGKSKQGAVTVLTMIIRESKCIRHDHAITLTIIVGSGKRETDIITAYSYDRKRKPSMCTYIYPHTYFAFVS